MPLRPFFNSRCSRFYNSSTFPPTTNHQSLITNHQSPGTRSAVPPGLLVLSIPLCIFCANGRLVWKFKAVDLRILREISFSFFFFPHRFRRSGDAPFDFAQGALLGCAPPGLGESGPFRATELSSLRDFAIAFWGMFSGGKDPWSPDLISKSSLSSGGAASL